MSLSANNRRYAAHRPTKRKRKLAKSWLPKFKYADCCSTLKTECKQGHNIFGNAHYQYLLSVTLLKMFVCGCRLPERFLANVLWLALPFFFLYTVHNCLYFHFCTENESCISSVSIKGASVTLVLKEGAISPDQWKPLITVPVHIYLYCNGVPRVP